MKNKIYTNLEIKKLDDSEVQISATVSAEDLGVAYKNTLKKLGENANIKGFRKGHIPDEVLLKEFGETHVLEKAAQEVLEEVYPKIIADEKLQAISRPQIQIKKLALGNPLEFTAKTAVIPEIKLPDCEEIAKKIFEKKTEVKVTDKDMQDVLKSIRKQKAQIDSFEEQKSSGIENPEIKEIKDEDLPELTDEFVKTLGDFKNVDEFTNKVRENLKKEKELKDKEKKRIAVMEEIIEQTNFKLPAVMVDFELARMQAQFETEVAQAGMKVDDYLNQINKTQEELRESWKKEAEKRAKLQLILNKIAEEKNIKPKKEDVDEDVARILAQYKDADEDNARVYVTTAKTNELVFQYLEGAK